MSMNMKTRLEYRDQISHKFWEISRQQTTVVMQWGRVGKQGQLQEKKFDSVAAATRFCERAVAGKLKKGYAKPATGSRANKKRLSLENALDAGPRRRRMPREFTKILRTWTEIKRQIGSDRVDSKPIRAIEQGFKRASWAWRAQGKAVKFSEVNRLGESFCGPPYTSAGFEWPLSPKGYPYLPLLQLDLAKASRTCGVEIGSGFLQLFETADFSYPGLGYFMRQVPRKKITRSGMLPIPKWTASQLKALKIARNDFYGGELEDAYRCIQVENFKQKAFSFPKGMF